MAFLAGIAPIISAIGGAVGIGATVASLTAKGPKLPTALPTATRDAAARDQMAQDELLRRRGGAADILNGAGGAEPAQASGKTTLGS